MMEIEGVQVKRFTIRLEADANTIFGEHAFDNNIGDPIQIGEQTGIIENVVVVDKGKAAHVTVKV